MGDLSVVLKNAAPKSFITLPEKQGGNVIPLSPSTLIPLLEGEILPMTMDLLTGRQLHRFEILNVEHLRADQNANAVLALELGGR